MPALTSVSKVMPMNSPLGTDSLRRLTQHSTRDDERDRELDADLGLVDRIVLAFDDPDEEQTRDHLGQRTMQHRRVDDLHLVSDLHERAAEQRGESDEMDDEQEFAYEFHVGPSRRRVQAA